jgi:hypothetical protein
MQLLAAPVNRTSPGAPDSFSLPAANGGPSVRPIFTIKFVDLSHIERQPIFLQFADKVPAYLWVFIIVSDFV